MSRRKGVLLATSAIAFAAITTAVGAASSAPVQFLVLDLVTGLTFVVAGLAAVWLRPASPAGLALLLSGTLWYVGSYAPTGQPALTNLGFAFEAYYDLVLAALLLVLSSPMQRLQPRVLIGALAIAMAARSVGRLVFVDPRLLGCDACAPNPFAVLPSVEAFEAVEITTNLAISALTLAVGVVAVRRLLRAGPVFRRVRWPILLAGGVAMGGAALHTFEYAWTTAGNDVLFQFDEPWGEVIAWSVFALRTLVPIGFLVATLRARGVPGPLGPLTAGLEQPTRPGTLGDALRTALGDPSLALLRAAEDGTWTDEQGASVASPIPGRGRAMTLVGREDQPLATIVHDAALLEQPELLEAVTRVLRLALENERLESELRLQLQAVTESRERILTTAEDERRRVERDLHDGAQQRLVGVMLALQQARGSAGANEVPQALRGQLDAAAHETTEAIRELRELARGIHPAILEDEGLRAAVTALARRAGLPVDVQVTVDARLPRLVESTAYYTVAEALTNTQRHAGASRAAVRVDLVEASLEVDVTDDGRGGADPQRGSGLRGLSDRITAVGGRLEVASEAGGGTRLHATIPTTTTT